MALELNIASSSFGLPLHTAYARITNVHADKERVRVIVSVYATAAARQADARPVEQKVYTFKMVELKGELFPALYSALKALPEYAGATDV